MSGCLGSVNIKQSLRLYWNDLPLLWTGALENARVEVERSSVWAARCRRREQRVQTEFIVAFMYNAMCCFVVYQARLADSARCSSSLPKSLLCLSRLAGHSRGEVKPAAAAASGIAKVRNLLHSRQGTYTLAHHQHVALYTIGAASGLPQTSSPSMPRRAPAAANSLLRCRRDTGAVPFAADSLPSTLQGFPHQSGY